MIQQLAIEASFDLLDLRVLNRQRYPHLVESSALWPQGRFAILIPTMVRSGARPGFRADAGIVSDSVAEKKTVETRVKAGGMSYTLEGHRG